MAENVLAMSLRMRNHATTVARNLKNEVKSVGNEATKMGTKFGKSVKATRTSMSGLAGSLISLKTLIIATFAYRGLQKFGRFLGSLTEETEKQEQAILRLGEALASSGSYSRELVIELERYAGILQNSQAVADDLTISNMALLATYGMQADEIKRVVPLIHDFAKAKGVELKTAFDLAGKAAVGYTGTLSRYGIILDQSLSASEKYQAFIEYITQYQGTAATMASSYTGQIARLSAAYGDMKEPMGAIVEAGMEQSGMLETLITMVQDVRAWYVKWQPTITELATKAFTVLNDGIKAMIELLKDPTTQKWFITLGQGLKMLMSYWKLLFTLIGKGIGFIVKAAGVAAAASEKIKAGLFGSDEEKEAASKNWEQATGNFWDYVHEGSDAVTDGFKNVWNTAKETAGVVEDVWSPGGLERYTSKMEEQNEALRQLHENEKKSARDAIQNRQKQNEVMQETIKISKSMAQQFASASRLEQEQTKYLLNKLQTMGSGDVGALTDMEKDLISKQGVLKEAAKKAFGEYASKELGLEAEFNTSSESQVTIDLTDEAKQMFQVASHTTRRQKNQGYEKSMTA